MTEEVIILPPLPVDTTKEIQRPKWWKWDWKKWNEGCLNPSICHRFEPSNDGIHHRQGLKYEDLLGAYWQCFHCSILQRIYENVHVHRLENITRHRVGYVVKVNRSKYLIYTEPTMRPRVFYLREEDHPIPIPSEWEQVFIKRVKYKLTKGSWSGRITLRKD